jgi:hypothetical protein
MSVIEVELNTEPTGSTEYTLNVLAGPIWSDEDAKAIVPLSVHPMEVHGTDNGQQL